MRGAGELHHIDASVILEPENTKNGVYCTKYLHLIGYKYKGKFSIPMLGELLLFVIRKLDNMRDRYDVLDTIVKIVNVRKIEIFGVSETEENFLKSKEILSFIDPTDRLLLACAAKDKAAFVTIDKRLLRIKNRMKENFPVDIRHPKEFLSF